MNKLEEKLKSMTTADVRGIDDLQKLFIPVTFRKGIIIGTPDHSYPILHYIERGLVVGNYISDDTEHPSWVKEHGFIPPIGGFFSKQNFKEFMHVLEDTTGYYLNLARAESLAQKNHHLYRMLLEIFEENMQATREREILLRVPNAYERFSKFMENEPKQRYVVTNSVLASILNINVKHLFKIKKRYSESH